MIYIFYSLLVHIFFSLGIMSLYKNISIFSGTATSIAEEKKSNSVHFHNSVEKRNNSESSILCQHTSLLKDLFLCKKQVNCEVTLTECIFPKILFFQRSCPFISVNKMRPLKSLRRLLRFIRHTHLIAVLMCYEPVRKQIT